MPDMATTKQYVIGVLLVAAAAFALFAILPQISSFRSSLGSIANANEVLVAAAVGLSLATCIFAALLYTVLAHNSLKFSSTLLVQLSGLLVNRVLPAGVGGLGLNIWYLRARRHSLAQATTIVTINNLLGLVGHMLLILVFSLSFSVVALSGIRAFQFSASTLLIGCAGMILVVGLLAILRGRLRRLYRRMVQEFSRSVRTLVNDPIRLFQAILLSCCLTLCNVGSFWLCCLALGIELNFAIIFFIFSFGVIIGTALPTPGGLGGVEAALFAGLMSQSIPAATALAAALLYRLVSYWLGLVIGVIALLLVRRRVVTRTL